MLTKVAESTFTAPLVDNSHEIRSIGTHSSTMTLYEDEGIYQIEWHIPALDEVYHIGLIFEGTTLVDYDGLYDLPKEAIALVRQAGFIVPEDF